MKYFLFLAFVCSTYLAQAQLATVRGKVTDNGAKQPVVGAKVMLGSTTYRAISDYDGNYEIKDVPFGEYTLTVAMLSFDTLRIELNVDEANFNYDILLGGSQEIEEVQVTANLAQERKTPVAVSNISTRQLAEELGSQDLPMILNSKPGVHATQQGGGDGDSRITIRGFDQRNIGVMIDGVPVNDMENGWVYWSNWFGLDAITSQIQVQRGLGATKLAMPSVGGTMNILTQNTGGKRQIKVLQEYGTGNFFRTSLSYKSGTLPKGWGILFSGSYKQGNGWVDGLNTQGGFYYLKIQKKIGDHVLSLSGFGAPQNHGQRSFTQAIEYWDKDYASKVGIHDTLLDAERDKGIRYNEHWGYRTNDKGKEVVFNERRNYYHKPQITLKDFWKVNKKLSWSNLAYLSIGRGGGERYFNSSSTIIRDENGQIDWDTIIYNNQWKTLFGNVYSTVDLAYDPTLLKSSQIRSAAVNNHMWIGGLSQFDYEINDNWDIAGGLDYRYYKGTHYTEVIDLLGGDYFVSLSDANAATPMKKVGDKIAGQPFQNHRDGLVQWAGGFFQAEYSKGRWTAFVNASTVTNFYKGIDYFQKKQLVVGDTTLEIGYNDTIAYNGQNYDRNSAGLEYNQTDWVSKTGATIKAGANFNITERANVFINAGYLSRTPQFSNVIDNTRNEVFDTLLNENILAFEAGYGFRTKKFRINLDGYFTRWENRPLPFGFTITDPNDPTETISVNVPGMDALHYGGEMDLSYELSDKLEIDAMASIGNWTWQSAEEVVVYTDTITFDARGVHVGDAAQSTYGLGIRYAFVKNAYFKVKYTFFDRYYSNFDPISLTTDAKQDSWRIPSYGLLSIHAGYRLRLNKASLNFKANVFNVLNTTYISDARNNSHQDGSKNYDANSATVFMGPGLQFNFGLGFEF